jgi:hypothetical protein
VHAQCFYVKRSKQAKTLSCDHRFSSPTRQVETSSISISTPKPSTPAYKAASSMPSDPPHTTENLTPVNPFSSKFSVAAIAGDSEPGRGVRKDSDLELASMRPFRQYFAGICEQTSPIMAVASLRAARAGATARQPETPPRVLRPRAGHRGEPRWRVMLKRRDGVRPWRGPGPIDGRRTRSRNPAGAGAARIEIAAAS